jgi:hypothetical protein
MDAAGCCVAKDPCLACAEDAVMKSSSRSKSPAFPGPSCNTVQEQQTGEQQTDQEARRGALILIFGFEFVCKTVASHCDPFCC